jgi:protein-tyrosine phosphatase
MRAAARQLKRGVVDLYWRFRGPRIQVPEIPADPRSILFVCKGNICRSPFAEHLASKLQRDGMNSGIKFGSAGLHVPKPTPSPESAIQVARQFGVELENHRSQSISLELVKSYDMIIAMEVWQYAELQSSFGQHQGKLFLLPLLDANGQAKERGYTAFNIQDPYGGPPSAFEECFERVARCIERVFQAVGRQ